MICKEYWKIKNYQEAVNDITRMAGANGKFSVTLMNPPFGRSLHLKFLEKVIQISDEVVSIQPIRWLQDPFAKYKGNSDYKKYEESISKHIKDVEVINNKDSNILFSQSGKTDILVIMNLGIFVCDKNGGYNYEGNSTILDKIHNKMKDTWANHCETKEPDTGVVLKKMVGGNNSRTELVIGYFDHAKNDRFIYKDGKRIDNGLTFYENRLKTVRGNVKPKKEALFISFDTVEESNNFIDSTRLYLYRYLIKKITVDMNIHPKELPFLGNYKKKWTNSSLYKYFDITPEEQVEVENLVNEYIEMNRQKNSTKFIY